MTRVLVTGASGYVGGRLAPRLVDEGFAVRCLVRTPAKLDRAPWRHQVEVVRGSLEGPLDEALSDVDVAVYLVHGIGAGPDWIAKERRDAESFRDAATRAGVRRIVYLGGMGADDGALSDHLRSRHDVGRVLAQGPLEVIELRAAVIIGSGSASFEMLRYLVEVLPVMVTPKWVTTRSQPIAISDVLRFLVAAIAAPEPLSGVFDIGGPDVVSYAQMMDLYAEEAGLSRRRRLVVPVLTPTLSSLWVGLVTPVPSSLARPLVDSLVNEVVVRDTRASDTFGPPRTSLREAIRLALGRTHRGEIPTTFTDADLAPFRAYVTDPHWAGGTELLDLRHVTTSASPEAVYRALSALGGDTGWYAGDWLWRLRGFADQVVGGPGLRRGRRDPKEMLEGDFVDFWRVDHVDPPHALRLVAEMRLPGEAWLEWVIEPVGEGSRITQRATFKPRGLVGRAYWYSIAPFHRFVFPGMVAGVVRDAENRVTR
ncbi:MAG: SDR family oxidoreductase [Acidimicrobiaceae bacterium]|nr:SDR family oxidoreductase [Acidimicrobiaceae bacterium]